MLVLMVPVFVRVLVRMHPRLVAVFMPIMGVSTRPVAVLVFMLVFVVAAHAASPPFPFFLNVFIYIINLTHSLVNS
jgi:hypothetical protein